MSTETPGAAAVATLQVSEIFGPTWQGEGPTGGFVASFIRLAQCNLACTWCDTPYTWDWHRFDQSQEVQHLTLADIREALSRHIPLRRIVITGGEPLIQAKKLLPLLFWTGEQNILVELETNGTLYPTQDVRTRVHGFNVSPKLCHSGNAADHRLIWPALKLWVDTPNAIFKFVCQHPDDLTEVDQIVQTVGIAPKRVWIMPEGVTAGAVLLNMRRLAPPTLDRGFNLSSRLQTFLWGEARGH